MGDIRESWPNFQGFDFAAFPIHQQAQLTIYNRDAADEEVSIGIGENNYDDRFTLDAWLRPNASAMVTGVEGKRGENVSEVFMQQEGEVWDELHYDAINLRYQDQALEHLRDLASKKEKPFFLEYWPMYPLTGPRVKKNQRYTTPNGGHYVEKMKLLDKWIGDILSEVDRLKIAENTVVIIMVRQSLDLAM